MGYKSFILVAVTLLALVAGAVGVYAYDASNEDRVAEGIAIAGIPVGGLSGDEARAKLRRALAEPLDEPLVITHHRKRFRLSAEDAGVRADIGGMVDEALHESREGNLVTRALRDLTGGEEDARIEARVSYSERAARRLVRRVRKGVSRPARDAELTFPSLDRVKERNGVAVRVSRLRGDVAAALTSPDGRELDVSVRVIEPEVTRAELVDKYPTLLVADRSNFQLHLYRDLKLASSYTVAVGAVGFDTPAGVYNIQNKAVDPAWSVPNSDWAGSLAGTVVPGGVAENPLKERWMGIYDGAGIHGTDQTYSLGTAASHGCIRMSIPDVIELYDNVEVGTPIYIG